jgi:hypothetical protein
MQFGAQSGGGSWSVGGFTAAVTARVEIAKRSMIMILRIGVGILFSFNWPALADNQEFKKIRSVTGEKREKVFYSERVVHPVFAWVLIERQPGSQSVYNLT